MSHETSSEPPVPQSADKQTPPERPRLSRLAVASFALGLVPPVSLACLILEVIPPEYDDPTILVGALAFPLAIFTGDLALVRIRRSRGQLVGRCPALAAVLLGFAAPILFVIVRDSIPRALIRPARASCTSHLKNMSLVFKMYSSDPPGSPYPPLSSKDGQFTCEAGAIYPEYLTASSLLLCPGDGGLVPESIEASEPRADYAFENSDYMYLGYVITSDDEMEAFAEIYKQRVAQGLAFDEDLAAPPGRGSMGTDTFYRLREDIVRQLVTDMTDVDRETALARIPVMWDKVYATGQFLFCNHEPVRPNVLYMDGHVERIKYPGKWPVTQRMAEITAELDPQGLEAARRSR